MGVVELLLIGVGLSMDALAVSVAKGLATEKPTLKQGLICGLWFGGFQALMPLIGWLLGSAFSHLISSVDHWIAFALLALIGGNMIKEAFSEEEEEDVSASFGFKTMLLLAVATSIDALAVGINFALLNVNILLAMAVIGVCTLVLSTLGFTCGGFLGAKFKRRAQIAGGVVLIGIGIKILVEHLFF